MKRTFAAVVAVAMAAAVVTASLATAQAQLVPYTYNEAYRSHNYARATSCTAASILAWTCSSICAQIPSFQSYKTFNNDDYDTSGFSGVDPVNKQIVVAFRSTKSVTNWLQNLNFFHTDYTVTSSCGSACEVHTGFLNSYLSLRTQVVSAVTELLAEFPDYQVLVTGHSLGGALAVHAAVDLQDQFNRMSTPTKPVGLFTLGAPRVGNSAFAKWTAETLRRGPHYRITHCRDPVPHLPPMSFGFLHAPTEVFYRTEANSSMRICADSATAESEDCSNDMFAVVISDHLKYLGESTGCSCDSCPEGRMAKLQAEAKLPKRLYVRLTWEYLKHRVGL